MMNIGVNGGGVKTDHPTLLGILARRIPGMRSRFTASQVTGLMALMFSCRVDPLGYCPIFSLAKVRKESESSR